jgi:hypothetical protein
MKNTRLLLTLLLFIFSPFISFSHVNAEDPAKKEKVQVLIIGLNDNVKSNYYYGKSIAEETGMQVDSIDQRFNQIIANNIAGALPNSLCKFVTDTGKQANQALAAKIEFKGEAENCTSSLSNISTADYQQVLEQTQASYLLVINQHYLKRQEQPMRTVFHIVSYTLYDKNQKEVFSGNQFYTSMKLESADKMAQISRKSTAKIAASVAKSLNL